MGLTPQELLEQATESPIGISVRTDAPERLRQSLYAQIRKLDLAKTFSLIVVDDKVYIIHRGNLK